MFSKKNNIHPFDDQSSLEFFSQKNDASLFCVGTNSKKRPNNLVFVRMFDYQVLDMIELGIENNKMYFNILLIFLLIIIYLFSLLTVY